MGFAEGVIALRPQRVLEATPQQVAIAGGSLGSFGVDPIDQERGYRQWGSKGRREVPEWTREKARDYAVTAYRMNPMCTAIIDTMTAFCVGASGVKPVCTNEEVRKVVDEFWNDPRNRRGAIQEIALRSQLLLGEKLYELMVGKSSGVVRVAAHEPSLIRDVTLYKGNALWPDKVILPPLGDSDRDTVWRIAQVNDKTGLREGQAMFWAPWRTLDTDVRGVPYIHSILDWLDSYDEVLSNLIDRTAVARYVAFDVTLKGDSANVDEYVKNRGGTGLPPSGSIEVHNESVEWKPMQIYTGADEDSKANGAVLTNIAAGAGLSKPWLADPEDANRATSMTMAEPVRRRIGGVQRVWLEQETELARFVVDRAVAARRLPETVKSKDPRTGAEIEIPASMAVTVQGPEIAAADAQLTAQVLLNLATGLEKLRDLGMSQEAIGLAGQKAWEDYMGVPWRPELGKVEANPDDVATYVEESARRPGILHAVGT